MAFPISKLAPIFLGLIISRGPVRAREETISESVKAPDGRKLLGLKHRSNDTSSWVEIEIEEGAKRLFAMRVPPEKEARYAKGSWGPKSEVALVIVNYKSAEEWVLLRLVEGKVTATHFESEALKLLDRLPFREALQSVVPVGRVPGGKVEWTKVGTCEMDFIYRGLGHEGTARVQIDFRGQKPEMKMLSLVPKVEAKRWAEE